MTTIHKPTQQTSEEQTRLTRRALLILIGLITLPIIQYVVLASQTGAWQLWVAAGIMFVYLLALLGGLRLLQRGHWMNAIHLVIHGLGAAFLAYTLVIAGAGAVLGLLNIALAIAIASQTLPARLTRITISVSIGLGVLIVLADLLLPPYRYEARDLQTILPIVLALVVVGYGITFVRRFSFLAFPTKLLIVLLAVSVIPLSGIALYTNSITLNELLAAASQSLANRAELQATLIGENLIKQAELLQTLALSNVVEDETTLSTQAHTGTPEAIQADLQAKNSEWSAAVAAGDLQHPLLQAVVSNPAVIELAEFTRTYPEMVDVVLTDRYGTLVAAASPNYDYFQADKNWWESAYNNGQGAIYFGNPSTNKFGAAFGLPIALPVYADNSDEVVGVIRATYKAEAIVDQLGTLEFAKTGHLDLVLADKAILLDAGTEPIESHLKNIATTNSQAAVEIDVEGTPSFAVSAAVKSSDPEEGQFVNRLNWRIFAHQSRAEVLAPVDAQTRTLEIVTVLITVLVAIFSFTLSQALMRPITHLTSVAEKLSTGNLDVKATVESTDEFGTLAQAFNGMTSQLRTLVATLEDRVRARTAQLRTSAEVGRAATSMLDPQQLTRNIVNLISDRFGFYYAALFLLDDEGRYAVLQDATGEAGHTLKERGHRLEINNLSMVGSAVLMRQARIALDVGQGATRFANPLLPNTRSEIALPLIVGDRVLGALDVQSTEAAAFDDASAELLQNMANQVAIALVNADTLSRSQQQARVLGVLNKGSRDLAQTTSLDSIARVTAEAVTQLVGSSRLSLTFNSVLADTVEIRPIRAGEMPVLGEGQVMPVSYALSGQAMINGQTSYIADLSAPAKQYQDAVQLAQAGQKSMCALPLRVGDRTLGALTVSSETLNAYSPEQLAQLEQVAAQVAVTLENVKLVEQTREALNELDTANRRLVGQAWEQYQASRGILAGQWRDGTWQRLDGESAAEPVISSTSDHALRLPLRVRGATIGEFDVAPTGEHEHWSPDDIAFAQSLVDQVGQAIENARLIEETESLARRERTINTINTRVRQAVDFDSILKTAVTELGQSLKAARVMARLNTSTDNTPPAARRGSNGDGQGDEHA
ncbi:MAG: GAF domain-containing protein [Anaerolineae bacterium]